MELKFHTIGAMVLLMSAAWAQNPADISFKLTTKDGKTSFFIGEAVEVEFTFQSTAPERYSVWTYNPERQTRQAEYDHFIVEPAEKVIDPLADTFAQFSGMAGSIPRPTPLSAQPVTIGLQVNEWFSIRQPGHYRITAQTSRVSTTGPPGTAVPLRSNAVEIDVTPAPAGWAAAQLQQAIAILETSDPPEPTLGQAFDPGIRQAHDQDTARAARTLRFLETREAARAMARFYDHGPLGAEAELRTGLMASPERKYVIAAMEEQVAAPDVPITNYYLGALISLVNLTRYGPTPLYTAKTPEEIRAWIADVETPYQEKSKSTAREYFGKLANAVARKQGQALAISLATLITNGPQPAPPAVAQALKQNFSALPENSQAQMLTNYWNQMGSPEMEPVVRIVAEGIGPLRDAALVRLWEIDPADARAITLDRIRKGDVLQGVYQDYRVLLSLPDDTLPEMDQPLVDALRQGKRVQTLIARYASGGVRSQIEEWATQNSDGFCGGLLIYSFRVDPTWAASFLARARDRRPDFCPIGLSPNEDLLMSPGLERQAIEDIENPTREIRRQAVSALQYAGSAAAQQPLMEGWAHWQQADVTNATDMFNQGIGQEFLGALFGASSWVMTPELVQRVMAACATDPCPAEQVKSASRGLQLPVSIGLVAFEFNSPSGGYASVGGATLRSRKQFEAKIAQYPKGTEFSLSAPGTAGTWGHDRLIREATETLNAAGMKIVERPRPALR